MKRSFIVCCAAALCLVLSSSVFGQCASPANIITFTYSGHTYMIVKEKRTWVDASLCAGALGGKLVEITSKEENDTLFNAIKAAGIPLNYTAVSDGGGATYIWIGATDKLNEGVWLWDGDNNGQGINFWNGQGSAGDGNGTPVPGEYNNWGGTSTGGSSPVEPDDFIGTQDAGAIALDFWPKGSPPPYNGIAGEWNDISLNNSIYYVIERSCLNKSLTRDTSICNGEQIYLAGKFQTAGGTYVDSMHTSLGCDSLVITNLTVLGLDTTKVSATICQGDTLYIDGVPRTQAGKYFSKFDTPLGCDSLVLTTLTVTPTIARTRNTRICSGDSILLGGAYQTVPGTYRDTLLSAAGCDSIVTTTLGLIEVDTSVTVTGSTLRANSPVATFQWLDCDNSFTPIAGATGQVFTPSVTGNYAVQVTEGSCVGISSCYAVTASSVLENTFPTAIAAFPNPARDQVTIDLGARYDNITIKVQTLEGITARTIKEQGQSGQLVLDLSGLPSGTYFLQIASTDMKAIVRVIKH